MVDVSGELKIAKVSYEVLGDGELRVLCPFHDDSSPSCDINPEKATFLCRSCRAQGHVSKLLARVTQKSQYEVLSYLRDKYGEDQKPVEATVIEKYHCKIFAEPELLGELSRRGVTELTIRKYRLGVDRKRITIPIANASGMYVDVRRYLPGASSRKFMSMKGRGAARLYPMPQLKKAVILLCGGEVKALAAIEHLGETEVGCVSATCGEGNWKRELDEYFRDKIVYVCYDIDKAGVAAADAICRVLKTVTTRIYNLKLPLDIGKHPKGDLNDFLAENGDLQKVMDDCPEWSAPVRLQSFAKPAEDKLLSEAIHQDAISERYRTRVSIAAVDQTSYAVPKEVRVTCDKNQAFCALCPVFDEPTGGVMEIDPEDTCSLAMMESGDEALKEQVRIGLGVPKCKAFKYAVESHRKLVEVRVQPELDVSSHTADSAIVPAVLVDCEAEVNGTYEIVGSTVPHPRTQSITLLSSKCKPVADALKGFKLDDAEPLKIFQGDPQTKLLEIYEDFEANVTRIFERFDLHATIDLTYHSPLAINFDGKTIKGCVETLVIGDSSQGKSEASLMMQQHYGLGDRVDCKNATRAGLLGGVEQLSGKNFITWGALPKNDMRLVIMEELKGMAPEVLASLTDARSSGIAEIPKIRHGRTPCRVRLMAVSNPKGVLPISAYGYGIDVITELVPALEDIRRFDLILILAKEDVNAEKLQTYRPEAEHSFTTELCRKLVLWTWTRTVDQVVFSDGATNKIRQGSRELCRKFVDDIPLLDRGSARYKIAKLAASVAARCFSTSDGEILEVKEEHAAWAITFIEKVYSQDSCGYLAFSKQVQELSKIRNLEDVRRAICASSVPLDFVQNLISKQQIEPQDLQDWNHWPPATASATISILVRNNALVRERRHYLKTPPFTAWLRETLVSGELKAVDITALLNA